MMISLVSVYVRRIIQETDVISVLLDTTPTLSVWVSTIVFSCVRVVVVS